MTATRIRLLLAEVDGTLVTQDKLLTDRAIAAVHHLHDAGVLFAITSGRPPRGMAMLVKPLSLQTPIAAFNGGLIVGPDMEVIEQRVIPPGPGRSHRRAAGIVRSGRVGLSRRGLVRP